MPLLEAKTHIATQPCADCGRAVQVKTNVNGFAYYFCPWCDDEGAPCGHHEKWGRKSSEQMCREYLAEGRKPVNDNRPPAANINRAPIKAVPAAPKNNDDEGGGNGLFG